MTDEPKRRKHRMLVDSKCWQLAEDFLSEIPGATRRDIDDCAELIQDAVEDACREVEQREAAKPKAKQP